MIRFRKIIRKTKDGQMIRHVQGEKKFVVGDWWGTLKEEDHLEGLRLYGKIILQWLLRQ